MSRTQKILTTVLWAVAVVFAIALVTSLRSIAREKPRPADDGALVANVHVENAELPSTPVPDFSLTDQHGQTVTNATLKGHPWVAAFIFTRCSGPCPMVANRMAELQKAIGAQDVRTVLFSLDPSYDTPAVLKKFGKDHALADDRTFLLTGPRDTIVPLASGMGIGITGEQASNFIHSEYLILVDGSGIIRGYFHPKEEARLAQLQKEIALLTAH